MYKYVEVIFVVVYFFLNKMVMLFLSVVFLIVGFFCYV